MAPVKLREKIQQFLEKITYKQLVGIAVAFSCLMGILVYVGLSSQEQPAQQQAAAPVQTVQVVVAAKDIPDRTIVTDDMVKVVDMPANLVPEGAYDTLSDVLNHPTSTSVAAGDVMSDKKVYADIRMAGFAGTIPPNCRAITIAISDITGISGFAKPGDRVDVMLVTTDKQDGTVRSEVLLQNVLLLAVNKNAEGNSASADTSNSADSSTDAGDSTGNDSAKQAIQAQKQAVQTVATATGPVNMASVTLALPMDEALRIAASAQAGTLYLVLRPLDPTQPVVGDWEYEIEGTAPAPQQNPPENPAPQQSAPAPAPAPQAPATTQQSAPVGNDNIIGRSIEVIRGTQSSRVGVE